MIAPGQLIDLGVASYADVYRRQLDLVDQRKTGAGIDTLLLVEHPHVITLGRSRAARDNVLVPGDIDVVEIERGGDVTYHGPGQLVAYPIVSLAEGERDLHRFLRNLEEAVIRTLGAFGLVAGRVEGKTGVWTGGDDTRPHFRKLTSIGIACRRWVTFHGLALNVTTDLSYFHRINPCGFDATVMTSMSAEGVDVEMAAVKTQLAAALSDCLGRAFLR